MQEISVLPGRIRLRNHSLYYNKALAKYINVYTDNLYGVKYSMVNPSTATILVTYDPLKTDSQVIRKNIEHALSSALENKPESIREYDEYYKTLEKRDKAKRNIVIFGLIYLGLKIKNSIYGKFALSTNVKVLQAASAVTIIGGYPLLKSIYKKLSKNIPTDSDILLTLTALSFTLARESSKGVLLLMLKAMNDYIKYSADAECQRLLNQSMNKTSEMAWLVSSSLQEILVSIDTLKLDDVIAAHEGEVIPVQGEIIDGSALVNTLYYTGQPVISRVGIGSKVHEGISVLSGSLTIKVQKVPEKKYKPFWGKENMQIHQRVSKYQKSITPVSLWAGAASYLLSGNIMNSFAVLLALTPSGAGTALSTGMKSYVSLLNKHKIFIRRPETFEKVIHTDHIIFDKTGTLTNEKMGIEFIASFDKAYSEKELLKICAACESEHYHPISITLNNEYKNQIDIHKVHNSILIPSSGVKSLYENHSVLIGNKKFMDENRISMQDKLEMYNNCEKRFLTPVLVSIDGRLTGMIAFRETLKKGAYELIQRIKQKPSYDISLLTGDNEYKAADIAQKLGISHVFSNCSDEEKADIVRRYKSSESVMMVGDGINDIKAMREADISISFAHSSCDMAKLNSDYIIFEDHMEKLADVVFLSQRAYAKINNSITLSQFYNIIFGGLAFVGAIDAFAAKSINTINSLMVLLLNKRIEYLSPKRKYYRPYENNSILNDDRNVNSYS